MATAEDANSIGWRRHTVLTLRITAGSNFLTRRPAGQDDDDDAYKKRKGDVLTAIKWVHTSNPSLLLQAQTVTTTTHAYIEMTPRINLAGTNKAPTPHARKQSVTNLFFRKHTTTILASKHYSSLGPSPSGN